MVKRRVSRETPVVPAPNSPRKLAVWVCQINPTIGDFAGNRALMIREIRAAHRAGADLVVFPELCVTGYYPGDLLLEATFLERARASIASLLEESCAQPGLYIVIGAPVASCRPGKALHNALLVLHAGAVVLEYHKQLLPTENVFDERRHFEPGAALLSQIEIAGHRVGMLVCEDVWNDPAGSYPANPFDGHRAAGTELVVCINASPSELGKRARRHELLKASATRHDLSIVYVNQVGGQDSLVFDGASCVVEAGRGVVAELMPFVEESRLLTFIDARLYAPGATPPAVEFCDSEFYRRQIVLGLRDYARRCGFGSVVVGSSGGIDSALTLALAVEALGAQSVTAITMPSRFSSSASVDDSIALCANLGVRLLTHPIHELVAAYERSYRAFTGSALEGVALENLQARVRGTILMEFSNSTHALLLTTGNKSEIAVGYCTLYGDTNGGIGLIGDLYKTEVFELARHLNSSSGRALIPQAIIDKPPSAELAPGQKDSDSLPDYTLLDDLLRDIIEGNNLPISERARLESRLERVLGDEPGREVARRVAQMVARNEYKRRQSPPLLRLRPLAFGAGRQMPIARAYPGATGGASLATNTPQARAIPSARPSQRKIVTSCRRPSTKRATSPDA